MCGVDSVEHPPLLIKLMVASASGSLLLRVPLAINVFVFSSIFNIEKILPLAFLMKNYSVIRLFALVFLEYMFSAGGDREWSV